MHFDAVLYHELN